jgi:hypothetical protein
LGKETPEKGIRELIAKPVKNDRFFVFKPKGKINDTFTLDSYNTNIKSIQIEIKK